MTAGDWPSSPTAVVFDLGGVLIDWDPRYLYRNLLPDEASVEWFLATVTTEEWNAAQDEGRPWADAVAMLSEQHPDHAELIDAYYSRWAEMLRGQFDETVRILDELRFGGVGIYALTNWSAETFVVARERFEWLAGFDGIVVSGAEGMVKPDPRIYRLLLRRYGLDASSVVFVDDRAVNVDVAREVGLIGLHYTGPDQLREDLGALGLPVRGWSDEGRARSA